LRIRLDFDINSGAASIIYLVGFFGILLLSKWISAVALNLIGIETIWTGGYAGFLVKRGHNNKIELEAEKAGLCDKA
jgi:positive regulator of sigma E activity